MINLHNLLQTNSDTEEHVNSSGCTIKCSTNVSNPTDLIDPIHHVHISDSGISDDLTEMPTLVEFYITKNVPNADNVIDISIDDATISQIQNKYKNFKTCKYICYSRNELSYLYDLTDDHQYVYSKIKKKDCNVSIKNQNLYMISYKFSKLPTHLFPCLNDIDDVVEYTIFEYKLTNRLSIIIKKDKYGQYAYIEYKHSPQIDVDKMQININNIINNILGTAK